VYILSLKFKDSVELLLVNKNDLSMKSYQHELNNQNFLLSFTMNPDLYLNINSNFTFRTQRIQLLTYNEEEKYRTVSVKVHV